MLRLAGAVLQPMAIALAAALLAAAATGVEQMPDPCDEGALTFADHSAWADVLRGNVKDGSKSGVNTSLVDYNEIRRDPSRLKTYMRQLCNVDLSSMPVIDQLALLANAYNALMVAMIVHYNPGKSVKEISDVVPAGSVWDEKLWTLAGNKVSLGDIEHKLIRGVDFPVNDRLSVQGGVSGRMHASLVCGSLSCPSLLAVPFEGPTLVQLITENTRRWLLNPTKNMGPLGGGVGVSEIFKWFPEDFEAESGSIQAFLREFAGWTTDQVADGAGIGYAPAYNWDLNAMNATGNTISGAAGTTASSLSLAASMVIVLSLATAVEPWSRRCC